MLSLAPPCYVISDIHLGAHVPGDDHDAHANGRAPHNTTPSVERQLLALLAHIKGDARSLVINGDLFDFWFEWGTVIPRTGFRTIAALADMRDHGIDILWIAGNHDCWGGEVLRRDVGVDYHVGPWRGNLAGWHTLIEHGDGLRGHEDRRYRAIRPLLRHPLAIAAFRWLPPDLATRIASGSSHASRSTRARDGGTGLRAVALDRLARSPDLELVIFGHSHVPTLEQTAAGSVYANAGNWLETPSYLRAVPEQIELYEWSANAQGLPEHHRLDTVQHHPSSSVP